MNEIWKKINHYEDLYEVSNLGNIKSLRKNKCLKLALNGKGYFKVALSKNGIVREEYVHRLVAEAFLPNPTNLPVVNHINGIKQDNKIDNLEWCSIKYNVNHAYSTRLNKGRCKMIKQYTKNGIFVRSWDSLTEASKKLQISLPNISRACNKKKYSAGGYYWKK